LPSMRLASIFSRSSTKMATGAANWSRHHSRIRLHSVAYLARTGNQERFDKAARYILNHQNEDGGWSIYAGGPSNITLREGLLWLKMAGFTADHPALARARKKILRWAA